jgi:hypothetical protein
MGCKFCITGKKWRKKRRRNWWQGGKCEFQVGAWPEG